MFEKLLEKRGFWSKVGPCSDVVLSTRVRLGRNLSDVRFPHRQDEDDLNYIRFLTEEFVYKSDFNNCVTLCDLKDISLNDRRFLRERNIITHEMETSENSYVIIENDENFYIMVNEEDHFRIQVIKPGFQIMETYRLADRVDDELNKFVTYAYSDEFGYLTVCPSNLGTGLRISTMLHLPALSLTGAIPEVVKNVRDAGAKIKGTLGEGSKTFGSMYQLFNRVSLGLSEVDILEEIDEVTSRVVDMESVARDNYFSEEAVQLEDTVWRSMGILRYSRHIGYTEAMDHLSNIRLGIILSILKNIELQEINDLMVNIQWSHLQKIANMVFNDSYECDNFRANYLRMQLD
ncbi:MAG: ATP--guanido phosphotransferase [Spirochaetota bacterium]|nr:ATP--guanido phosphotransferase [Spirochaetota bacterium]